MNWNNILNRKYNNNVMENVSYDIIEKNLDLVDVSDDDPLRKWKEMHFDIRKVLDHYVDTSKYTSGEVYRGFTIEDLPLRVHNALQDCYSILYALNAVMQ